MEHSIVFYTNPMSRAAIVRWMLEETGLPYEEVVLEFGPPMKTAEYRAINPMGKVPAIVHNSHIVTESAAICLYLADVFPQCGLAPLPEEKADYYRWTFFAAGPVEHAVTARALDWTVPEGRSGMVGYGSYDKAIATLEAHLGERDHVCGSRFTAADVYVGSAVIWGLQFGTMPRLPAFEAYAKRLVARPAHARAKERDNAVIAQLEARRALG